MTNYSKTIVLKEGVNKHGNRVQLQQLTPGTAIAGAGTRQENGRVQTVVEFGRSWVSPVAPTSYLAALERFESITKKAG